MAQKTQHASHYRPIPGLLRDLRETAGMSQRAIGERLGRPQSWVYNCEVGNRRVDVAEFCLWCLATGVAPADALMQFLKLARLKADGSR